MKGILVLFTLLISGGIMAEDWNSIFAEWKSSTIISHDLPSIQMRFEKLTGKKIKWDVDWDSFKGAGFTQVDFLGSTIQTTAESLFVNSNEKPEFKKLVTNKVSNVKFTHAAKEPKAKFTFNKGTLSVIGNYKNMNWTEVGSVGAAITTALNSK